MAEHKGAGRPYSAPNLQSGSHVHATDPSSGGTTMPGEKAQDWSGLDLGLFGISGAAMVGMLPEINKGLISSWGTAEQVVFGVAAGMSIASLGIGLMTAGYRGFKTTRCAWLSASCAKFSTVLSIALLITVACCKIKRIGCVAGVSSASVIASIMIALWIYFWVHQPEQVKPSSTPAETEDIELQSIKTEQPSQS